MSKDKFEEVISSDLVFRGKFLQVVRDKVRMPQGKESFREYILHPGAAMIIPEVGPDRLIVEKQYRHALKKIFLEFPAGKIDKGETSLQAGQRELLEETGYVAKKWQFLTTIHPVIGYANEKIDIYLAGELHFQGAQPDGDEDLEIEEISFAELQKKLRAGEITDVKTQIGIFWYEKFRQGEWS